MYSGFIGSQKIVWAVMVMVLQMIETFLSSQEHSQY